MAAAVVASILYLALQTRQAAKSQNTVVRQGRTFLSINILLSQAANPSLADACRIGFPGDEGLSPTQYGQFQGYCGALFVSAEDSFLAHRSGIMDDDTFKSIVQTQKLIVRSPGLRASWLNFRPGRHPAFVAFYETLMAESPLTEPFDSSMARWKENLATIRAQAARQALPQAT